MINEKLFIKINEVEEVSKEQLFTKTIKVENFNILKVRDYLIIDGSIVDEDLKNQIYTAYYRTGFLKLTRSIVGIVLEKDKLTIASTSEKITNKIADDFETKKNKKSSNKQKYITIASYVLILSIVLTNIFMIIPAMSASSNYNDMVDKFNNVAKEYNKEVVKVFVDNIEGVPGEMDLLSNVEEGYFDVALSVLKGNSSSKIKKDINTIESMITTLNEGKIIIEKIYKPSSKVIESYLKNIDEIDKIKSVNKDNDPNGMLGKEHGYIECIYFTIDDLTIDGISNKDPIVLGTNGGGCIEVYSNVEDAKNRCEYLSQFDNTLLYSGSYAVVGTMVIRTSYVLTEHQQYTLTNYIVEQFTK